MGDGSVALLIWRKARPALSGGRRSLHSYQETRMTRLKVKPICAAIMLMSAYGAPALAQTATGTTTTGTADTAAAAPEAGQQAPAVVRVTGLRQSLRSAEDVKRDAVQVVDAINADDIGKFPDRS